MFVVRCKYNDTADIREKEGKLTMRIERTAIREATSILAAEGCLVVEAQPKAGLTVFLASLRDSIERESKTSSYYINCALPGFSLRQALSQQLSLPHSPYPALLAAMKGDSPLFLLLDRPDLAPAEEYRELLAFLHTLNGERLFCPSLSKSGLVLGISSHSVFHAACRLEYFSRGEVSRLPGCQDDSTARELHYWSGGSPAIAAEISRYMPQAVREGAEQSVYRAVVAAGETGRLGRLAAQDLTPGELLCQAA
jgi:hypothetical protein